MPSAARLLLLETSGRAGFVGVAEGPVLRGQRRLDEARRHARDLAPATAELLAEQGWRPRDLAAVFVSRGPGSYTGLRVGVASAQALAYAVGCAVLAVDTFDVLAMQAPSEATSLAVLADAQQDRLYVQSFGALADGRRQPQSPLEVLSAEEFIARGTRTDWLTGPALHTFAARFGTDCRFVAAQHWDPTLAGLLAAGLPRWLAGERTDWRQLEPLYARLSEAERKWEERQGGSKDP
ncbi:MAG: tRNA (adenosine(37)-N6)-threonylcarbamoyltransferase complex dimerization subunit type 1 TsaB [Planctomycetia bacterium]|nr:tRNA (adenosine(37)-N6)-threonylcarbamoyltransferase complex dimerization subunit type 1 TsaB [Planctomycetia bacterium]